MKSVWRLVALLTVMAPGAFAQVSSNGSSAIEQALIEHACRSQLPGAAEEGAYPQCLSSHLLSLRADYGSDLSRVSAADRKTLDSACSMTRTAEGREAYLECLTVQLVSIHNRGNSNPTASLEPAPAPQSESARSVAPLIPESQPASWLSPLWIGVGLVTLIAAGGGALLAVRGRRVTRKCRACGDDVPEAGDLCPKCRHEAADALRHATAERAEHDRAQAEEGRQQSERQDEERRQQAAEEEAARLRRQEGERELEEGARLREKEEEASRQRNRAVVDSEEVLDPYSILGVPRDASKEAIEAALQAARLKYAPDKVAHLGSELQEHYRRKAESVERAYQILTE